MISSIHDTHLKFSIPFILLVFGLVPNLDAQEVESPFFLISNQSDSYDGNGVVWITDRADSVQFVMFGEQHGVEGIAQFVDFIYQKLHAKGFHYLVLETDGWTTKRSAAIGIASFTKKNPHSIAFDSNSDLQLMQTAIDLNPSIENPIWGVDQMQTAIHPYHRLTEIANTSNQKRIARGAFLKASLKMGAYTRQDHQEDVDAIEIEFAKNTSSEKDQILKEVRQTMEIFFKWMNPTTRNESVETRELLMGSNFDGYLKSDPNAKAVFKMGGAHTMYGIGPNGILTFGNHVKERATAKNQATLSISIYRYNPERTFVEPSDFGDSDMLLIDSKAALSHYPEDSIRLNKVDAIILLKDAPYASKSINRAYEKAFRNSLIRSISLMAISLLVCLITAFVWLVKMLLKRGSLLKYPAIASLSIIGLFVYQILIILNSSATATIVNGVLPTIIHIFFFALTFIFTYQSYQLLRSEKTITSKLHYVSFTLSFGILSYYIYYWNIGGMLG